MAPIKIGIIGGSGVDAALASEGGEPITLHTPFGQPSAPIIQTKWMGVDIAILKRHGPGHIFPPHKVPYRANIFAMKLLGVTHIIATGATGSLREQIHPGDLVIPDQVIDKTSKRPSTFFESAAVHVELANPFCPVMRRWLLSAADHLNGINVHPAGTYVAMEGPAFSTRAESNMHRQWGGDLVGMTCMPEARLAKEAEIAYALIALPTDYDCWIQNDNLSTTASSDQLLQEIIGNLNKASEAGLTLIRQALTNVSTLKERSPSHDALKLAIWSDKEMIDELEIERLAPLWGRYF